jgi:hypothetical protein
MFARDCSFLLGKPITVFFRERDRRHLRDQMSGATRELEGRTWDTWLQTAESTPPIAISITIAPILGRGSFEPTGFRWLIRDLTECMRTKDRIRDLEDGLWRRVAERTARLSEENERLKLELSRIRTKVRNQPGESEEASPEPVRAGGSSRDAGRRPNSGRSPSSD